MSCYDISTPVFLLISWRHHGASPQSYHLTRSCDCSVCVWESARSEMCVSGERKATDCWWLPVAGLLMSAWRLGHLNLVFNQMEFAGSHAVRYIFILFFKYKTVWLPWHFLVTVNWFFLFFKGVSFWLCLFYVNKEWWILLSWCIIWLLYSEHL